MTIYDASTEALGNNNPTVAFGLTEISFHGSQMPFIDLVKASHGWNAKFQWGKEVSSNGELEAGGYLDENGWVKEIPADRDFAELFLDPKGSYNPEDGPDIYVLEYEGEGTLRVGGSTVKILSQEDGKITFSHEGGYIATRIFETDPDNTGDYVRNLSIVNQEHVELHEAGAIFNPDWLDIVSDSQQFRFMDWMETNQATAESWADYPTADSVTWSVSPVEVMVRLANEAGVDPWFNIPHTADDDFVRQFAEYVRDNLDPDLTVRVEWSNEVWNGIFDASKWAEEQAVDEWGSGGSAGKLSYQAKRATEVALIWEEVFAESNDSPELINVLGGRTGNTWSNTQILTAPLWEQNDPDGYVAPHTVFDELAITTYFGQATTGKKEQRDELFEKILDPNIDAIAWLGEKLLDPDYARSVPAVLRAIENSVNTANQYGLDIVAYEGGQHVHQFVPGLSSGDREILNTFMEEFIRSPEMAELYSVLYDGWADLVDNPFMQFNDVGAPGQYGSWSLLKNLHDTNPRAEFLLDKLANDRAWWDDNENDAYLHGKNEVGTSGDDQIIGTDAEDFLAGGAGNDEIYAAQGRDGINGGAGNDRLFLAGNRSEYTVSADGNGHLISGPDGVKFVINVETFTFRNGETVSLNDFLNDNPGTIIDIPDPEPDTTDPEPDTTDPEPDTTDQDPDPTNPDPDTPDQDGNTPDQGDTGGQPTDDEASEDTSTPEDDNDGNTTAGSGDNSASDDEIADGCSTSNGDHTDVENEGQPNGDTIYANAWHAPDGFGELSGGISIRAVNQWEQIGKELQLTGRNGLGPGYVASEKGASITFTSESGEDITVGVNYNSLNKNLSSHNGEKISGSAVETAEMFGEIIVAPDAIYATQWDDNFSGREADDVVYGGAGNDILNGRRGHDTLDGGADDDRINGGRGSDNITGGEGSDNLTGGKGADRFYFTAGDGHDTITDFELKDTLDLDGYFANDATLSTDHTKQDSNGNTVISNGTDSITLLGLSEADLDSWLSIA